MGYEILNSKDCDYLCYQNPLHAVIGRTKNEGGPNEASGRANSKQYNQTLFARTTVSGGPSGKNHSVGPGEGRLRSLFNAHPILPHILLSYTFSISCNYSCRPPPHTLKRQKAAIGGKKRPYYTAQSGHGAIITHQTPVSCVIVCNKSFSNEENKTYQPDY